MFGLETKKVILSTREGNAVRNRVQVYPTKLSASNSGNNTVRLRFKKTPIFQTLVDVASATISIDGDYTIDSTNAPITVTESGGTYLQNGESIFGWFRGRIEADRVTVFGRLYKDGDAYYFEMLDSFNGNVVLITGGSFLPDSRFTADGDQPASVTDVTKTTSEIEGLSSLKIANDTTVPIAGTGNNVATIYLQQGTEQFDLNTYFDYNKEYLSFPLTDIADSLYFAVDSDTDSTDDDDSISLGVTWEEQ